MAAFYRWILIFSLICLSFFICSYYDIIELVNKGDFTKISFGIFGVFTFLSVFVGKLTYGASKLEVPSTVIEKQLDRLKGKSEIGWFFSNVFLVVGMIGTVLGMIVMTKASLSDASPSNIFALKSAIGTMFSGMSAALYTTATGLICSVLLQFQLFNLKLIINEKEKACKKSGSCSCHV
jgi:hypothetical protein